MNLPLMKTAKDAIALCEKEHDNFYLTAFMLQTWVGGLFLESTAKYAEHKKPRDRSMQTGQAWRAFLEIFGHAEDAGLPHIFSALWRFAEYNDPLAKRIRDAFIPLSYEHEIERDYIGPETMHLLETGSPLSPSHGERARERGNSSALNNQLIRRTIQRLCDWLDSIIHLQTHEFCHLAPECFDPGLTQRLLADASEATKAHWDWHHSEAARQFKDSPKWRILGQAMAAKSDRLWLYADVDVLVISLWPLVKKHNWTYRDLITTIRPTLKNPEAYPCEREQDFATYCGNVLGLRKTGKGVSAKDGRPAGYEVARRLVSGRVGS